MATLDTASVEARLKEELGARAERDGIAAAYLFGSVARGTARPDSDVDVAVLFSDAPSRVIRKLGKNLQGDLGRLLGLPVKVMILNFAKPEPAFQVLQKNILLGDWDRSNRIRFEVKVRNEYWDFEPYLMRIRSANKRADDEPNRAGANQN